MVAIVIAAVGAASFYSLRAVEAAYTQTTLDEFKDLAANLGEALAAQFYERYGDVQAFALNPSVRSMNPKAMQSDLDTYVGLYGIYDVILVVDKNGRFVASNTKDSSGKVVKVDELRDVSYASAPWFKAAMAGEFTEDKDKGFTGTYYEDPHLDPVTKLGLGEVRVAAGFTTVIKDANDKVVGVISNRSSTKWYDTELLNYSKRMKISGKDNIGITVATAKGSVIVHTEQGKDGKPELRYDYTSFGKEDVVSTHVPAGKLALEANGGVVSQSMADKTFDVVGYNHIVSDKWPGKSGWAILIHDDTENAFKHVIAAKHTFLAVFGTVTGLALLFAVWFAMGVSKTVRALTEILERNSGDVAQASDQVASSSQQLSEGSTEQAAALQQTVAAVDEISAMVDRNAESANRSKEASVNSREAALRGRQSVDQMLSAIGEISSSNDQVSTQMVESNNQLGEITKLINDISSKTKIINEIVFQTKLLSFNASVEAARAGEYGKGFAVVAEEVGNLAQMSGNAAKEISALLEAIC